MAALRFPPSPTGEAVHKGTATLAGKIAELDSGPPVDVDRVYIALARPASLKFNVDSKSWQYALTAGDNVFPLSNAALTDYILTLARRIDRARRSLEDLAGAIGHDDYVALDRDLSWVESELALLTPEQIFRLAQQRAQDLADQRNGVRRLPDPEGSDSDDGGDDEDCAFVVATITQNRFNGWTIELQDGRTLVCASLEEARNEVRDRYGDVQFNEHPNGATYAFATPAGGDAP